MFIIFCNRNYKFLKFRSYRRFKHFGHVSDWPKKTSFELKIIIYSRFRVSGVHAVRKVVGIFDVQNNHNSNMRAVLYVEDVL